MLSELRLVTPMNDWRDRAACLGEDPELFFTEGTGHPSQLQIAQAKQVCRRCPVKAECLAWAVGAGDQWAVAGETTPAERRHLQATPPPPPRKVRTTRWCVNCPRRLDEGDLGRMCNACRQAHTDPRVRNLGRAEVLAEQFPQVGDLVQELPGVRDRSRRRGRMAVRAL